MPVDPAVLATLSSRPSPEAIGIISEVVAALPTTHDPDVLRALAAGIPTRVGPLPAEVSLALARLAQRLVPWISRLPEDIEVLSPRLRSQWLRVAVAVDGDGFAHSLDDTTLWQVLHEWPLDTVLRPLPLLETLCRNEDPAIRSLGLRRLREAVADLAITTTEAFSLWMHAAEQAAPLARVDALTMLQEGWLQSIAPAQARRRDRYVQAALQASDTRVASAAVLAASALGRADWLTERLVDPHTDDGLRSAAMRALGKHATNALVDVVLTLAHEQPLRFDDPARVFLLEAHRHGVFVRVQHLPDLLEAFDRHHGWTARAFVRVAYIRRNELVAAMSELPPDDPRWVRRAALLPECMVATAATMLSELLQRTTCHANAEAFVLAASRSGAFEDEDALLQWLDELPEAVLPAIAVKGGPAAYERAYAIAIDPRTPWSLRRLAMPTMWALAPDRPAPLRALATALGPHESGLLRTPPPPRRDDRVAQLLVEAPWADTELHAVDPELRMSRLCDSGGVRHLPEVEALFRERMSHYVRLALAGDFTIKRVAIPELEQHVYRYGRHLVAAGYRVRGVVADDPETGRDLLLRFVFAWLEEDPADAIKVALLETIGRHEPRGATFRALLPWWRHGKREVRRAALEAIIGAGHAARGLELSLCRLTEDDEPRIVVQALAAVKTLVAQWAEPMVCAALRNPSMAVKKAAAEALGAIATARSIPTIVHWLAHHDNAGLRVWLSVALERAAGPTFVALLVHALETETDRRRVGLLTDAIDGRITLAAVVRLARSRVPTHQQLVEACLEGAVRLANADRETLAAELHRTELVPAKATPDPGRRLRVEGFSGEAASALVDRWHEPEPDTAAIVDVVRGGLAEWVAWLPTLEAKERVRALPLVLQAAEPRHHELHGALLRMVGDAREVIELGAVAGFIERCVDRPKVDAATKMIAIELLRGCPPSASLGGRRRYARLGTLGALRVEDDLWRCLEETRLRPDAVGETVALLGEALQIPARREDEPMAITELRDGAREFAAKDERARREWLAQAVATRPLDLPPPPLPRPPSKPRSVLAAADDLQGLLDALVGEDAMLRGQASSRLLAWSDARHAWPQVLTAFIDGRVECTPAELQKIAPLLTQWPKTEGRRARAERLWTKCAPWQRRALLRIRVERWEDGDDSEDAALRRLSDTLLPLVWEAAVRGDYRRARLLRPGRSLEIRTLADYLEDRSPEDAAALRAEPPTDAAESGSDDTVIDPIAALDAAGLVALIEDKSTAKGLAVRAIHALSRAGESSADALERFVTDPRAPIRSAALRALRKVAPRSRTLDAVAEVLAMETRPDVVISLMKSLGHGRHTPSLGMLVERLHHREPRLRSAAADALRAFGVEAVPSIRRMRGRARPDRRATLDALLTELQELPERSTSTSAPAQGHRSR